jgi:hypothetical protein
LKPCGYLNSIFGEGLDNYIALYGHSKNGIPPIPSPPCSFHLVFFSQIFHLCADWDFDDDNIDVAVSGWRLMFRQIKAKADLKFEDSSKH